MTAQLKSTDFFCFDCTVKGTQCPICCAAANARYHGGRLNHHRSFGEACTDVPADFQLHLAIPSLDDPICGSWHEDDRPDKHLDKRLHPREQRRRTSRKPGAGLGSPGLGSPGARVESACLWGEDAYRAAMRRVRAGGVGDDLSTDIVSDRAKIKALAINHPRIARARYGWHGRLVRWTTKGRQWRNGDISDHEMHESSADEDTLRGVCEYVMDTRPPKILEPWTFDEFYDAVEDEWAARGHAVDPGLDRAIRREARKRKLKPSGKHRAKRPNRHKMTPCLTCHKPIRTDAMDRHIRSHR